MNVIKKLIIKNSQYLNISLIGRPSFFINFILKNSICLNKLFSDGTVSGERPYGISSDEEVSDESSSSGDNPWGITSDEVSNGIESE